MKMTPRTPPTRATRPRVTTLGMLMTPSLAHRNRAGRVKMAPAATDSPAEPMVCTRLFSKMESRRRITRMIAMEITAAGMDAEMVIPTFSPR